MSNPVVNIQSEPAFPFAPEGSTRFGASMTRLSDKLALQGIGCGFVAVEPGKRAFPFHNHLGNDELFVIMEGTGTYRFGDNEFPVGPGDVCAAPRGGPDTAHQLVNTGDATLRYLAISTKNDPEIVEYPDSQKFAALAIKPGTGFFDSHLRFVGRRKDSVEYFDGEEL